MALDGEVVHGKLTGVFGKYVENELKESPDKQIKMSEFFKHIDKNYSTEKFDSYIIIGNTNIKSIYFDESRWDDLVFEIPNFNELQIDIDEKHKASNFFVFNCENITLRFGLKSNANGFVHQNNFSFERCKFKMIEIVSLVNKYQFAFNYKLNFLNCEIGKMSRIENKEFNNSLFFRDTTFKEFVNFNDKTFNDNIKFIKCTFKDNVYFNDSIFNRICIFNEAYFKKEAYFRNCTFNDVKDKNFYNDFVRTDFSMTVFEDNAYFNGSEFNQALILYEIQFNKYASFFNVKLNNVFEFSSCLYRGTESINFAMLEATTNIAVLQKNIDNITKEALEKIKRHGKEKETQDPKNTYLESLRNSFAFVKHNFIQRNNLIEANKYRVAEFYVEELRLKYVREMKKNTQKHSCFKNLKTTIGKCWTNIKKYISHPMFIKLKICSLISLIVPSKTTIDYWQLRFYRHTSDHHSDLLKSFNTMLLLIGLFTACNYLIVLGFNTYCLDNTTAYNIHGHIKLYEAHINYFISTHETWHIFVANLLIILAFLGIFVLLLCLKNLTFIAKNWFFAIINWLFILINRTIVLLSYLFTLALLAIFPKSIISITNLFSGNQHILDPLSALSGIYTILFILLIYSLQKTSRRNSIM